MSFPSQIRNAIHDNFHGLWPCCIYGQWTEKNIFFSSSIRLVSAKSAEHSFLSSIGEKRKEKIKKKIIKEKQKYTQDLPAVPMYFLQIFQFICDCLHVQHVDTWSIKMNNRKYRSFRNYLWHSEIYLILISSFHYIWTVIRLSNGDVISDAQHFPMRKFARMNRSVRFSANIVRLNAKQSEGSMENVSIRNGTCVSAKKVGRILTPAPVIESVRMKPFRAHHSGAVEVESPFAHLTIIGHRPVAHKNRLECAANVTVACSINLWVRYSGTGSPFSAHFPHDQTRYFSPLSWRQTSGVLLVNFD